MKRFSGKGVNDAVAIGNVSVFKRAVGNVSRTVTDDPEREIKRVEAAREKAIGQLSKIYEKALREFGQEQAQIFDLHIMMLEDYDYNESIQNIIRTQRVNAEYAVAVTCESFAKMFASMDDAYMQARAADVKDISSRLISCLCGADGICSSGGGKTIICADDLAPSETVSLDKDRVMAFVTAFGSSNSHTAILARSMGIPAVIGAGEEFLSSIKDGDRLIVDGGTGELIIAPDEETEKAYLSKQQDSERKKALLCRLKGKPSVTKDGREIAIYANISGIGELDAALANDAGGIGLFRSEFLYLESDRFPTEEQQLAAYRKVLEGMAGRTVIIRTLDIGADKQIDYFGLESEPNPALGFRAVRICLTRPEVFKTQLRALYRASVYGRLGIMFPMITSVNEVEKCLAACEQAKSELKAEGLPFSEAVELGIMIETPAAAIISDRLAPMVDFFSVGTNDLTQYTLACDRQNARLEPFVDTHHEAVLRLIELAAKNAHDHGKQIGICGELAADTSLTEAFLKMGIDELSVSPPFVLPLKEAVRGIDLS